MSWLEKILRRFRRAVNWDDPTCAYVCTRLVKVRRRGGLNEICFAEQALVPIGDRHQNQPVYEPSLTPENYQRYRTRLETIWRESLI